MKKETYICDWCGKTEEYVKHMVLGPNNVCICDSCIGLVIEAIDERKKENRITVQ